MIERVCRPGYVPSTMDIIRAPEPIETLKETELRMAPSSRLKVIEFQEQQAMKILPQFAGVQCCLFTIDLTCYDRYLNNTASTNALRDRISRLKDILLSPHFSDTLMMLVFTNRTAFAQHIIKSPLKSHFPDYEGGNNVERAAKYILKSCRRANYKDRALVWHTLLEDMNDVESTANFFRQSTLCRQVFMTYT
jgi:guanine nucleotide-binding protein G(i) subunit alpha